MSLEREINDGRIGAGYYGSAQGTHSHSYTSHNTTTMEGHNLGSTNQQERNIATLSWNQYNFKIFRQQIHKHL